MLESTQLLQISIAEPEPLQNDAASQQCCKENGLKRTFGTSVSSVDFLSKT
jgi:hypothetical protein